MLSRVRIKNALRAALTADRIRGFARQDSETLQVLDWRQMNRNIFASLAYQKARNCVGHARHGFPCRV